MDKRTLAFLNGGPFNLLACAAGGVMIFLLAGCPPPPVAAPTTVYVPAPVEPGARQSPEVESVYSVDVLRIGPTDPATTTAATLVQRELAAWLEKHPGVDIIDVEYVADLQREVVVVSRRRR